MQIDNRHKCNQMETQFHPLSYTVILMATTGLCPLKPVIIILGQEQLVTLQ